MLNSLTDESRSERRGLARHGACATIKKGRCEWPRRMDHAVETIGNVSTGPTMSASRFIQMLGDF